MVRKVMHRGPRVARTRLGGEQLETRRVLAGDAVLELSRFETAELESFLLDDAMTRWEGMFGQPGWQWGWNPWMRGLESDVVFLAGSNSDAAAPSHSDTNTQVAGVDEGDIVETDGNFLYILSGQELVIARAWEPSELQVVSRTELEGQPIGLFLRNDRLTVISNSWDGLDYYTPLLGRPAIDVAWGGPWWGYPAADPQVIVSVLDVTDRAAPQVVQHTQLDGSYIDSRAVGDTAYVITSDQFSLPAPELQCDESTGETGDEGGANGGVRPAADIIWDPSPDGSSCVYETREEYMERVSGRVFELALPHYSTTDATGEVVDGALLSNPTDIYKPISKEFWNLISVSEFDMAGTEPGPASSVSVPTTPSTTVYGSAISLYLTNPDWGTGWGEQEATSILKFDLSNDERSVDLVAVGQVAGRVLNSFSLDEHVDDVGNEYLRIATTRGWGEASDNRVFVLNQHDEQLEVVGQTESLAAGEQIFSVRYVGSTAYVVTFLQVDPLFTIDLSDPTAPQVVGELKIPGFSNYMQPVGDGFLIGLGRDADPSTGRVEELQVSLFDVSNLADPQLADRFSFDVPGWAWTEAIGDHHAISYFPQYQVLTIPVSNDGWVWADRDADGLADVQSWRPRTDLYVFGIDLPSEAAPDTKAAVRLLGTIEDDAQIRRSVRIEQFLYSISDNSVTVHEITDPAAQVAELHFGQEHVGVPVFQADRTREPVQLALQTPELAAPQVVDILMGSTQWNGAFVNYLDSQRTTPTATQSLDVLPFAGVDQIKVTFSEDVIVGFGDLIAMGSNGTQHGVREFTYDVNTYTAVWTLAESLAADSVSVRLTSSVVDLTGTRLDGDANGVAGGSFRSEYQVLPGDVDRDGRVDLADLASAQALAMTGLDDATYSLSHDVNGDGQINEADFVAILGNQGATLPGFVAPPSGDTNRDGRFDSQDLIHVMQAGKYRTGQLASWDDGDWNRDGLFDEADLLLAFQDGHYQQDDAAPAVRAVDIAFELLAAESDQRSTRRRAS